MFRASLKLRDGEYTDVRIYFFRVNFDMEAVCVHVHRRQSGIWKCNRCKLKFLSSAKQSIITGAPDLIRKLSSESCTTFAYNHFLKYWHTEYKVYFQSGNKSPDEVYSDRIQYDGAASGFYKSDKKPHVWTRPRYTRSRRGERNSVRLAEAFRLLNTYPIQHRFRLVIYVFSRFKLFQCLLCGTKGFIGGRNSTLSTTVWCSPEIHVIFQYLSRFKNY